jgi:type II secretory pathway component PulJ
MGFNTILDILGSMIIGGIILTMMGNINERIFENTYSTTLKVSDQSRLPNVAMIMENDIKKLGYCADYTQVVDVKKCILTADTSQIKFLYDLDLNGTMDTIYYYLGQTSELSSTPNPDDRYLYRKINSQAPVKISDGVTKLYFKYYNASDVQMSPVTDKTLIKSLEMAITMEPGEPVLHPEQWGGDPYPPISVRQTRITSRNLLSR